MTPAMRTPRPSWCTRTGARLALGLVPLLAGAPAGAASDAATAGQAREVSAAPQRQGPPPLLADPPLPVPDPLRFTLPGGLPVLFVERHAAPLVDVLLVVRRGAVDEPDDQPGLAALTAEMLGEGAGARDALAFAEAVAFLGARLDSGAGFHATQLSLHVPAGRLGEALPLLADAALRPRFSPEDLKRVQALKAASFEEERADPGALASAARARLLFADHRYGGRVDGTPASVAGMTTSDLRAFHQEMFRPDDAYLVVVGDVDEPTLRSLLAQSFGSWQPPARARRARRAHTPDPGPAETRWVIVDRPGSAQSVLMVATPAPPDMTPWDAESIVMNTLLGGSFSSRLNRNLREDKQYAYGARSAFLHQLWAHAFVASASVARDVSGPALQEMLREISLIRSVVYDDEGRRARGYASRSFPGAFATGGDIAQLYAALERWHLRHDLLRDHPAELQGVSDRDILAAARRDVDVSRLRIVVVGDRARIEPSLQALGLGSPLVWDAASLW